MKRIELLLTKLENLVRDENGVTVLKEPYALFLKGGLSDPPAQNNGCQGGYNVVCNNNGCTGTTNYTCNDDCSS